MIVGTQIAFGEPIFNIVNAFDKIDNTFAVFVLILALNMGMLAFVLFGNLFPAGLQMSSLYKKNQLVLIDFKVGTEQTFKKSGPQSITPFIWIISD
ncbi:hypothetical protein [Candidatus Enterococcus lemimoniae]|uniref:hypothetical protein n=1 Tax=Candidatus Enterococcus lemimoniae TaxID=1834167 RepID=UPI000B754325|nr:hypothetical protein [Enterococcus sp. 12C11_DIV0727]OTO70563.1 hypothetical protein A5866_002800 [Enterococcus sp. 12C11_DIV0727]